MLNFLNPTILFALAAGFIPLLIHLLNRRKTKEIRFSTVHFLKKMERKEMRRLRIRQILLLIIRTLIILLLVLVFARPTIRSDAGLLAGRTSSEVVVIIDNSLSLNSLELTGNLLEKVRQEWISLEPAFESSDRISVILGVKPLKVIADREWYSPGLWEKIAKQIQPSELQGNLSSAMVKSYQIFRQSDLYNQELYILSDFQQSGFSEDEVAELKENWSAYTKVFCLPVHAGSIENLSIDSANVVNRLLEKNLDLKIEALVSNHHPRKNLSSLVSLILNGNRVAQKNVSVPPGGQLPVTFETTLQQSGHIAGLIESEGDALLEDNRYYFNFFIPTDINILHIKSHPNVPSYLPAVLKPAVDKKIFSLDEIALNEWPSTDFLKYQTIILEDVNQIPSGLDSRLKQFAERGNGIVIIPGEEMALPNFNKFLSALNTGQFISREGKPGMSDQFITMGQVNWDHPLFEGLFNERKALNPIRFNAYFKIKPAAKDEVIIRLENGDPFLTASGSTSGNVYLFSAPLQLQWTDLTEKGFVVPLFYRIIYHAATDKKRMDVQIEAGNSYAGNFRDLEAPFNFELRRPSGTTEKIVPVFKGSNILLQVAENPELGNYEIWQGDRLISIYSVNHSPAESHQEFLARDDLDAVLPNMVWIGNDTDLIKKIETSRFGRELWPFLLGLVLILLFAEMLLAYTGSRKQSQHVQPELAQAQQG